MFKFSKVASLLASAAMLTSTVALAAAASYPGPFLQNGSAANTAIVYTSLTGAAHTTDLAAVNDILTDINRKVTATATTGNVNISGGDNFLLQKANKIHMGDNITTEIGSATLTDSDLPVLLKKGVYSNYENTEYKYEQKLTLGNTLTLNFFAESDYKDRTPSVGINIPSSTPVLNYTLEFSTEPASDVVSDRLDDFEKTTLNILGHDYYILRADNGTTANMKFTLLDSANSASVKEGETVDMKVGDKSYTVSAAVYSATSVKVTVNGETTVSLSSGGTQKLKDGTYVGIREILYNAKEAGISSVELSLGTGKLEITSGSSVKLNDNTVNEVVGYITEGTTSGSKEKISKIVLEWKTDDREYVTPQSELIIPGFQNVKLTMTDFVMPSTETTKVTYGSTDYVVIKTTLKSGDVTIPILYANSSGDFIGLGQDANKKLVTNTTGSITSIYFNETNGDEYLVASYNTTNDAESYLLTFSLTRADGINKTTVRSWETTGWVDRCTDKKPTDVCTLGNLALTIQGVTWLGVEKGVSVTGTAATTSFKDVFTKDGLHIFLPYIGSNNTVDLKGIINLTAQSATQVAGHSWASFFLYFDEEDKTGTIDSGTGFNVTLDGKSDGSVEASTYGTTKARINYPDDSNHYINYVFSELGTKIEQTGDSSSQREVTIEYHGGESYGKVYVAASTAVTSSSGGTFNAISIDDNNAAQMSGKNLVVVGGSCVNKVAAQLLGLTFTACGETWQAKTGVGSGEWLIQTFDYGGKVATLVAGYNAPDTVNAKSYFLADPEKKIYLTSGKKLKGTSATSATVVTV